jgi:hypothetical protein
MEKTNKKTHPADGCVENRMVISNPEAGTEPQHFFVFHRNHLLSLEGLYELIIARRKSGVKGKNRWNHSFSFLIFPYKNLGNVLTDDGFVGIIVSILYLLTTKEN